ncbi:CpaE-like family protein [Dactylosporangium fulvum]|uniref:CpaE-like family protein n=1 Tax=Dactylosporangium fulvum TaxID=53359 RepID=A0ABY5W0P4_9ACTN|nr:septum site-determining protein Ssd [Dactylosporangium fulvum]UWP82955.1 CpaE-like family protein [Dactylosporangium fulvum]
MHRPLLVTDDHELLDDVLNLAAALPLDLDVESGPESARSRYTSAPIVLIGEGSAAACAQARLPHRSDVFLLSHGSGRHGMDRLTLLADAVGADHIVQIPDGAGWLLDRFARLAGPAAEHRGRILAVLGGRGGAGASVLAAGLAVTAGNVGLRSLLVDADPLGGGVDLVLGWEDLAGLRWPGLAETTGVVDPPAMVDALPSRGDVAVLSCDREAPGAGLPSDAMAAALDAGSRGRDLVVADLPRRLDDAAVLALRAADRVLLIVPAELRACVAAARVAATVTPHTDALHLVVRGPAPGRLRTRQIARSLGLPVAGTLRAEADLPRRLERGAPPAGTGRGPLAALCRRILGDLGLATGVAA